MSLPDFTTQSELFSTAGLSGCRFAPTDRFRLFAQKVYPALARTRSQLERCYCADNGREALEPVLLLGVSLWQVSGGHARPSSGGTAPLSCGLELRVEPAGG